MSDKIDNEKIGIYVSDLIESKYPSARKFCIAYLKTEGNTEFNEDDISRMANRLSQIKKGKKSIQIHDLPIFSKLLGVSYEQILNGESGSEVIDNRLTNYIVAKSYDRSIWNNYIKDENCPILNSDEYGKTVLDYAIEFKNYELIKFLVKEEYIWFDSQNENDYVITFGAGTNIQKIKLEECGNGFYTMKPDLSPLENEIKSDDTLRMHIISLAADNNDLAMLEEMRAREIPALYRANYLSFSCPDFDANYDETMVDHISKSRGKVLEYFTDSFEISDNVRYKDGSKRHHVFIFPYISQLLDLMIKNRNPYLKRALEKIISHNENTEKRLTDLIKQSIENENFGGDYWKKEVEFNENGNIVIFRNPINGNGIITNIAKVSERSGDPETDGLIERLNGSYDRIKFVK